MKNIKTYILLLSLFVIGCETTTQNRPIKDKIEGDNIDVLTIDSCEYIYIGKGNASWGSHKGNCRFCIQRNKK